MKNSILGKARWLREVALATSKNNGARVAREWLKYTAMFVMLLTLGSGNVWGTDVTFTVNVESSSTTTMSKGDVTVSTTSGTFSRTDNYRIYANNSMTITSSGGNITQVAFNITQNTFTANVGTWTDNTKTWTGDASSVTFSASGGQVRITSFTVTINSSVSCTECTYYVYNGSTWVSIGTTGFDDVVLAPPTLPDNNHGAGNGCWTTDKDVFTSCTYYASGDKFRYVPNPGGAAPTSVNKPGSGTCELYAVYADGSGCLSTTITAVACARIWEEPTPNTPSVSGSDVTLSWSSVTGASGYHLYVTDGDSYEFDDDVNSTSKTLSGLAGGTYMWTVAANSSSNDACDSNPADGDEFEIVGCTDISGSTVSSANISVTPAKTSAAISWNAVANASSYEVKVYAGATATGSPVFTASPDPTSTSCTATGLTANTQYTVAIKAKNACSTSSTAGTKTFTTLNLTLYTVTFVNSAGSAPSPLEQTSENQALSIPQPAACDGWDFAGWKVGGSQISTTSDPTGSGTWITSNSWPKSYTPTANITVYAVFKQTTGGGSGASAGTTLWSEDFSGYSANDVPDETISSSDTHTGTTVYSGSVTYACTNGTGNGTTKIYNENTAGGEAAPELMVCKYSGTFAITGIPKAGASVVTVYFTTNNQNMTVASSTTGYTGSYNQKASGEHSFDITCGTASTFDLTFTGPSGNSNIRLDDIQVKVKTAGASGTTTWTSSPDCATSKELTSITIDTDPTRLNYVTGELFDQTGAVVTAHYDDLSYETVTATTTWSPSTALTAGTGQTATASYTEGDVTKTATVTYNVYTPTLLKKDESGTTIDLVSPAISRSAAVVTADATGNSYQFKEWQITGGTFNGETTTSTNPATITSVTGAVTVTAVYYKPVTVTWYVNGNGSSNIYHTDTHARGWGLMYPSNPDPAEYSCDGKVFVGWTRTFPYTNASVAPTFVSSGTAINSDESLYAVFAVQTQAGTPPTWTKTAFGSVSAGTYLMCTADGHVFNGEISSGHGQITASAFTSFAGNSTFNVAAPNGSCELTFTAQSSGWKMYNAEHGYLYCTASTAGHVAWNTGAESNYWFEKTSQWRYSGAKDNSNNETAIWSYSNATFRNYVTTNTAVSIVLLQKTSAGTPATYSDYTTSCACEGYSFHTGSGTDDQVKATNTRTCFVQDGTDNNMWKIENYVIPSTTKFFVGYQDEFQNGSSPYDYSVVAQWTDVPTKSNNKWQGQMFLVPVSDVNELNYFAVGQATGAKGTLRVYNNSGDKNKYVNFEPDGYGITYGGTGHAFGAATSNKRETEVVTLPDVSSTTYTVGLATATAGTYVTCAHSKAAENINAMGVSIVEGGKKKILLVPGSFDAAGAKYAVYDVTNTAFDTDFMTDEDGDGVWEGYVGSNCATMILCRMSSSATTTDLSNKNWDARWNQTGNINIYDLLNKYTITSLNGNDCAYTTTAIQPATGQKGKFRMWDNSKEQNWFVHFIPYYHLTYDGNGGGDAVTNLPASPADVSSEGNDAARTVTVANTDPVRSGYRFMGWADTQAHATAGTVDHAKNSTIVMTGDKTIYAVWKQEYTVTYDLDGGSASPACDGGSYLQGDDVTVCTSTPGGKAASTFNGWIAFETGNTSNIVTISEGHITMPSHNVTIKATWTEATFVLTQNVGSHTTAGHVGTDISSSMTNAPGLDLTYTIANIPANDDYALPKSITISGGGQTWVLGTNYTWTLSEDKHSATLHIGNNLTISANVTVTITEQTRYTVVWDEHSIRDTVYKAADDNTVTEITVVADCGQKKFYRWTEDGTFVSDEDTPPAAATFGNISGDKHYYAVYADATTPQNPGYEKVTTISAGTYLIANPGGTQKAYQATDAAVSATITDGVISSLPTGATEVTVTLGTGGNAGYFAISYDDNGTEKYLYGGKNSLSATTTERYDWSLGTGTYVGEIISKCTTESKTWYLQNNSSYFRAYAHTQNVAYLYKKQTTTYENFSMTCDTYDITIDNQITGGTVTTTPTAGENAAGAGQPVTVTITPDDCKYLTALVYNDGSDHDILSSKSFTMPAHNVTITATFATKTVSSITPTSSHRMLMQGTSFVGEDIRVTYSNGESEDLIFGDSKLAYTGYNMSSLGNQTVTVTYTGCGSTTTTYSITITDGIVVTFSDCGIATERKYDPGQTVPVESIDGAYGCSGWVFAGWSETSVAANSTSYTPVSNFSASTAKTLYAVYSKEGSTWLSAFDLSEMRSGAKYVIVKNYSAGNQFALTNAADGSAPNYLDGSQLATDCEAVREPGTYNDRYRLTVTPTASMIWVVKQKGEHWTIYSPDANKYLKITSDGYTQLTTACEDEFILTEGYDDSAIDAESTNASGKHLSWYNSSPKYWNGYGSAAAKVYWLTNNEQFSSTPPCAPRSVDFHGNGGQITEYGESQDEDDPIETTITEATRDAGIRLPSARFADCNGKSWTFVGWSDAEIDVTRIPVLTTDLLEDGVAGASHTITADDEEYWAVFTNQGNPETKYGTISFVKDNFNAQYSASEATVTKTVSTMGDYIFGYVNVGHQGETGIQFQENSGELYNKTSLGKVNSVSFTTFTSGDINKLNVYVGNEEKTTDHLLTAAEMQIVGTTWTYYPNDDEEYLYITNKGKGNGSYVCLGGISIDFGQGTEVWATTPDCSVLTLSGDVKVTSTSGQNMNALTPISIFGNDLDASESVTLKAYNVSDDTENTHFSFSAITKTGSSIATQNITVTYNPSGVTTDGIENVYFKAVVGEKESNQLLGYGRHLPAKFIIAEQVEDDWFALPNNMRNNYTSSTKGIKISAVSNGVATIYSDTTDQFAYQLLRSQALDNAGMVFSSPRKSDYIIKANTTASTSTIGLYAQSGWSGANRQYYEFTPTTSDLVDYTLQNTFQTNYLGITSTNWGIGASANVRFLAIDQHAAPTLTWKNDMIDGNDAAKTLATTKGENGVAVLPTIVETPSNPGEITEPAPCSAASSILSFDGWVTATWSGYRTTGFTKVNAGDAVTSDKTYYAVFKTTDDKYFTQCPAIQTVTYTANGGTGADVVESYIMTSASGTSVTLKDVTANSGTIGFSRDGYVFVGWTTSSNYSSQFKYAGNSVTVKPEDSGNYGDLTLSAVWVGALTISGDVHLTSYYTSDSRAKINTVYTTANPNNLLTVSIEDVPTTSFDFKLRISYLDNADNTVAANSTPLRLAYYNYTDKTDYNDADNDGNLAVASGTDYSQTFAIGYKPLISGGATGATETYKLKLELVNSGGDKVFSTAVKTLYGRVLPTNFVIAAKSTMDNQWYALPANLSTSSGGTTKTPYLIKVDNTSAPTKATYAPANALLTGAGRYAAGTNTGGIRLKSTTTQITEEAVTKDTYVTAANSPDQTYLYLTTGNSTHQDWYLTSNDFSHSQYTVQINPTQSNARSMRMYSGVIGYYTTGTTTMYILPVETSTVTIASVVEWGKNSLIVEASKPTGATKVQGTIGEARSAVIALATTNTSVKGTATQYNFTMNFGNDLDFSQHNGELLILDWKNNDGTTLSNSVILIPRIIAENTTMTGDAGSWKTEVHVLPGVTLTAATYDADHRIRNLEVYPSAKVLIPDGETLYVQNLSLHAGWTRASGKLYDVARVYISSTGSLNKSNAYIDWYIDYDQYYPVAVPFPASITDKPYKNATGLGYSGNVLLRYYDGAQRAENGQTTLGQNWKKYGDDGNKAYPRILDPSKGYAMTAKRPTGRAFSIIRMPLTFTNAWTTDGEKGVIETTHKDTVYVEAYGVGTESAWYAQGWNFVANPYMAVFSGSGDELNGKLQDQHGGSIRYATIPDIEFKNFDQQPIASAKLKPASGFFIQVGETGYVQFAASHRQQAKASILSAKNQNTESEAYIELNGNGGNDMMGLLISDNYTDGYDINADLAKVLGETNALKTYMTYGGTDMAYVAISENSAKAWIPVTVRIPAAGEYTFTMSDASVVDELEGIYLIDYSNNQTTNLINNDYTFSAEAGTISGRFAINGIVGEKLPTTVDDIGGDNDGPQKFIYHQKMYILNNGVIYDAVGKKVREINK